MAPPNVDSIIQEIEKINLQSLAREKGHYVVYPETKVLFSPDSANYIKY